MMQPPPPKAISQGSTVHLPPLYPPAQPDRRPGLLDPRASVSLPAR